MPKLKPMQWVNESKSNPGFSVYYAKPKRDANIMYVLRYKRKKPGFKPIGWRVFVRSDREAALQTIHIADTLTEAKAFVQDLEEAIHVAATSV